MDDYLTVSEAGSESGIPRRTLLHLIQTGRLVAKRTGPLYLVRRKDLRKVKPRGRGRPKKIADARK